MLNILFEDEYIIAVNKAPGILVIPIKKDEKNTLTNKVNEELSKRRLSIKAHPCHRLDRDTSGVILFAKGKKMQQEMMELFHKHLIKKKYLALAEGYVDNDQGEIKIPIEGKPALTKYNVIKRHEDYTVLEIEIFTGRTNQIRIHFKYIGHPLLGDTKFAFRKDFKIKLKRTALHAIELEFIHPETKEKINLKAPVPIDINKYI
jgi:23S rRNA pseudouridine1911/1915/1917 synthase